MSGPEQVIDLTADTESLRWAKILTPAGIVRVNTGLVDTRTGQPCVVVEIDRNAGSVSRVLTQPGGDWDLTVRDHRLGTRTDITLTRRQQ